MDVFRRKGLIVKRGCSNDHVIEMGLELHQLNGKYFLWNSTKRGLYRLGCDIDMTYKIMSNVTKHMRSPS